MEQIILFDVDGVLLDSLPLWNGLIDRYLAGRWEITAPPGLDEACQSLSLMEAAACLKEHFPQITFSVQELADDAAAWMWDAYVRVPARPGMQETIKTLYTKGYPLYLATASEEQNVEGALRHLGVWHCFQGMFTCTEIGFSKSYVEYYEIIATRLQTVCEKLVLVEDSLYSIKTAKKAGLIVAGVYEPESAKDEGQIRQICDVYVDSLPGLLPWFAAIQQ